LGGKIINSGQNPRVGPAEGAVLGAAAESKGENGRGERVTVILAVCLKWQRQKVAKREKKGREPKK